MIIQFCLKIDDLWRHLHLWVGSCQVTKKSNNLDLIKIIQFNSILICGNSPHLLMGGWVDKWVGSCQTNSDNSILFEDL